MNTKLNKLEEAIDQKWLRFDTKTWTNEEFMYLLFTYTVLPLGSTTTLEAGLVGRGDLTTAAALPLGADTLGGVTVVLVYE